MSENLYAADQQCSIDRIDNKQYCPFNAVQHSADQHEYQKQNRYKCHNSEVCIIQFDIFYGLDNRSQPENAENIENI